MRRCDSAAIVPNTSELLPEPETPVNTVSRRFGISTLTSLRLFTRAPCTRMRSWLSAMVTREIVPCRREVAGEHHVARSRSLAFADSRSCLEPVILAAPAMSFGQVAARSGVRDMSLHTLLRRLVAPAAVLLAATALTAPAHANLAVTGLMNPQTGFPAWYEDANGTRLELCIADPGCPVSPPVLEPIAPNDEAFYSLVSGTATGPAGQEATMDFAIEAAFLDTPVTFGRVQVTMTGMQPDSDYTFTYPYGSAVWTTDAGGTMVGGFRAAARHEVGCFTGFATPCDTTLGTEIGPFLTWDPAESAPPAGYIGDGVTSHTVVGAANNFIRVTGPGLPLGGISTDRFTVEGKLATAPFPIFFAAPGSGEFGTQRVGMAVTRRITVKNTGLASTKPITAAAISGPDAADFATSADTCAGTTLA